MKSNDALPSAGKAKHILLIEDNKQVQNYNRLMLNEEGYTVKTAMTLAGARDFLAANKPDAIILDIGMPDGSGLDFLRELRAGSIGKKPHIHSRNSHISGEAGVNPNSRLSKIPVLLLSGYGEAQDIVQGFKSGCDDYLQKPYAFEVLLVRLKRLLHSAEQVPETVSRGALELTFTPREAFVNRENLMLTPKDFELLHFFVQNENRLMNSAQLYESVWGQSLPHSSRALNIAVSRLRKKIADSGYTITAEYGTGGYRFECKKL